MSQRRATNFKRRSKSEIRKWLKTSEGQTWLEKKIAQKHLRKAAERDIADTEDDDSAA